VIRSLGQGFRKLACDLGKVGQDHERAGRQLNRASHLRIRQASAEDLEVVDKVA
jgi:hypothetical protein